MSDYQRFVSYIYGYVQGEKKESTGFVKVNARGSSCRIWIHMRGFYLRDQKPYRAYLFVQQEGRLRGVLLGELKSRNGALEWSAAADTDSLMGSGICLKQSRGIYIEGNQRTFAAEWDDYPVDVEHFEVLEKFTQPEGKADPEPVIQEQEAELEPESVKESELEPEQVVEAESEPEIPVMAEALGTEDRPEDSRWERWEYLTKHFPVMRCATGDDTLLCSIRLSVRELLGIPRDHWELGSNSFLLHGSYQYGHLLLLRHRREQGVSYLIGVPGIYNEREQLLASMFGFEEFKVIRGPGVRSGGLGYWCKTLEEGTEEKGKEKV